MRLKKVVLSCNAIKNFFVAGSTHRYWVEDGIPEDAKVVGVVADTNNLKVVIVLEHPDFPHIGPDDEMQEKMIWCLSLPEGAPVGR